MDILLRLILFFLYWLICQSNFRKKQSPLCQKVFVTSSPMIVSFILINQQRASQIHDPLSFWPKSDKDGADPQVILFYFYVCIFFPFDFI